MTVKAVWHIVKEFAKRIGVGEVGASSICGGHVLGSGLRRLNPLGRNR